VRTIRARGLENMPVWTPDSWRSREILQSPKYPDSQKLLEVEARLSKFPALVFEEELESLKAQLAQVAEGNVFLLQAGSCAENLSDTSFEEAHSTSLLLKEVSSIFSQKLQKPSLQIGRIAGQFAKPRSSPTETVGDHTLPVYSGDLINGREFHSMARIPDPERMERAYFHSAQTLERLRARHQQVFTSHEALLLPYEQSLTRVVDRGSGYYASSAHLLWIGNRTRQLENAHVEYARGIENPVGLKCGSDLKPDELLRLIERLNPRNRSGKIVLITRFGSESIGLCLPALIRAVQRAGLSVVWSCDPMHGNTYSTASGYKTRHFENILAEARSFFAIHRTEGSIAGGLHLELTGREVVECTGGSAQIDDSQISGDRYETLCDPRLNPEQARELANQIFL
jgi:3-deoxy-7-phosphoheptulonate synthase